MIETTLCLVQDKDQILLGMKKRGFGAGRWNGFGGKVEPGENLKAAARRELLEEAGITAVSLEKVGFIDFIFQNGIPGIAMHIFAVTQYEHRPVETEEMRPQWFLLEAIPFSEMWPDDIYWFPLFLAGKKFRGQFIFKDESTIERHSLIECLTV